MYLIKDDNLAGEAEEPDEAVLDAHCGKEGLVNGAETEWGQQRALRGLDPRGRGDLRRGSRIATLGATLTIAHGTTHLIAYTSVIAEVILPTMSQHQCEVGVSFDAPGKVLNACVEGIRGGLRRQSGVEAGDRPSSKRPRRKEEGNLSLTESHRCFNYSNLRFGR